ncbi:hypothetical protein [Lacrimispora brassicae]
MENWYYLDELTQYIKNYEYPEEMRLIEDGSSDILSFLGRIEYKSFCFTLSMYESVRTPMFHAELTEGSENGFLFIKVATKTTFQSIIDSILEYDI